MSDFLSFRLTDSFVEDYRKRKVPWGFPIGGGNSLSELTFIAKYSRKKEDGSKEEWWEVCRRCVEGMYSILKDHARYQGTSWNDLKAQKSAQDAFDRMFQFKWTPPGRGLQHMGTEFIHVNRNGARLVNCAGLTTDKLSTHSAYEATMPFMRLMEMSLNGIGVGIDTRGAGNLTLHEPLQEAEVFVVPDTREGWAESLGRLLESFFFRNRKSVYFDYSEIRPEGAPLNSFGGTASGPEPLRRCHEKIRELLSGRGGETISSRDIVDIANLAGKAVVSGGSRRSAIITFGLQADDDFINLKNWELEENFERTGADGWAWLSNNSVLAKVGDDLSSVIDQICINGEPGVLWVDAMQQYGRLEDSKNNTDYRAVLTNPCFSGDTLIAVADGRGAVSISELADTGDDVPVYSMNPKTGEVEIKWGRHPRLTGSQSILVEIEFNDGSILKVTPDHEFPLLDGTIKTANDLRAGDRLPAFTKRQEPVKQGGNNYWRVYSNIHNPSKKVFEHRLIAKFNNPSLWETTYDVAQRSGWIDGGLVVHHKDYNPLNNHPDNLEIMTFGEHTRLHGSQDNSGEKNPMYGRKHSDRTKELIGSQCKDRWSDPKYREMMSEAIKAGMTDDSREAISRSRHQSWRAYYLEQEANTDLETIWIDDRLCAVKHCEACKTKFTVPWRERERCFCSQSCVSSYYANKYDRTSQLMPGDPNFGNAMANSEARKENQRAAFAEEAIGTRQRQVEVYLELQQELARSPMAKEWHARCKERGVPHRFQAQGKTKNPNILSSFKELKELAEASNHRVVAIRPVTSEDVFNITVDDYHTVGIVTRTTDKSLHGIYAFQCGEIGLEGAGELCNLSELYPTNHASIDDFKRTIKHAYMYTKAVTLLPTPWFETNEVIIRNRRIGVSMTGIAQFVEERGWSEIKQWMNEGYLALKKLDQSYSEWLGVRESIKVSTVKPAGSTSLIAATTPGVHWPTTSGYYLRRVRFQKNDPLVQLLADAGYHIEDDVNDPLSTVVATFPTEGVAVRSEREVSLWEKAQLAALAQRFWSDNLVSCTLSFFKEERDQLGRVLSAMDGQLKSASFLPIDESGTTYAQAPYEPLSEDTAKEMMANIKPISKKKLYKKGLDAEEEMFCTTDKCELRPVGASDG